MFKSDVSGIDDQAKSLMEFNNRELPDLPDTEMMVELKSILSQCQPFNVVPSSARMRRVLRHALAMLEEKMGKDQLG